MTEEKEDLTNHVTILTLKTGNSMQPIVLKANELGLLGIKILKVKLMSGGNFLGEEMVVHLYGIKDFK